VFFLAYEGITVIFVTQICEMGQHHPLSYSLAMTAADGDGLELTAEMEIEEDCQIVDGTDSRCVCCMHKESEM